MRSEPKVGTRGLVPTMGAFHEGHLELMRRSRSHCDQTVVSLFVNPLQFGPNEDLSRYPRQEDRDFEMAADVGVDIMFAPSAEELLPNSQTTVHVAELAHRWEGARRPGHFDGVATIVAKLFNLVRPETAYFGWKDFQQCAVVDRIVTDLNFPLNLTFVDTYREPDGLAMSSRNAYLSPEHRKLAPEIYRTLVSCRQEVAQKPVSIALLHATKHLNSLGFLVDYFALVDTETLEPLDEVTNQCRLIVAAKLGNTWLIDNLGL